jgi:uncharacterized protein
MIAARRVDWTSLATFLVIAFGASGVVWLAIRAFGLPLWVSLAASWGPAAGALLVRGPLRRDGFGDSGLFKIGKGPAARAAYAVAIFLIPLASVIAILAGLRAGAFEVGWNSDRAITSPNYLVSFIAENFGLAGLLISFAVVPLLPIVDLGEEIGWRDYLVPRLLPLGQLVALPLSGAIWAAWHLPFNLLLGFSEGAAGFPLFALDLVLFGSLLGYLRLRSGSVWPCAILHTAYNYQPWVVVALSGVKVGFSPLAPEQAMALAQYAFTMLAGVMALIIAGRAEHRGG